MKQVTVHTYRQDTYYPRVVRAVATILARSDVVAPVDVLLEMGNLTPKNYEAWYRGHVPSLERVCIRISNALFATPPRGHRRVAAATWWCVPVFPPHLRNNISLV